MTTSRTALEGYVEAAGLDPIYETDEAFSRSPWNPFGTRRTGESGRREFREPLDKNPYGRRGLYVLLTPIKGLTGPGVFPSNKPFAFQCPPMNEFGESGGYNHSDYETISAGEHTTPIGPQLRTVQFDTLFLDWEPEWALVHDAVRNEKDQFAPFDAQKAVKRLCQIRDHGKPFHLIAHQTNAQARFEVDYAATLRQVDWKIVAGEVDAYYVTVSFKEFRTPDIQEFLVGSKHHPHVPASLIVKDLPTNRNTLVKLAKFYYGDPSRWKVIAARNSMPLHAPNRVLTPKLVRKTRIFVPRLTKRKK